MQHLPEVDFTPIVADPKLPDFPAFQLGDLVAFLDASHAPCPKTRKSYLGMQILFAGAVVAYRCVLSSCIATSSTEAEFYAAVLCAKAVKHLRNVYGELKLLPPGPTRMLIDNLAAHHMINEERPTPRARHVDIQWFAVQQWVQRGDIVTEHIPGVINCADSNTKALAHYLHSRHNLRAFGHYGPPKPLPSTHTTSRLRTEAGEDDSAIPVTTG